MSYFTVARGTEAKLENIPITDGQMYLCDDTGNVYFDFLEIGRKPMSGGGQKTPQGGSIFGDYENNRALGEHSSTFGSENISGSGAYKIVDIDIKNKKMTLRTTEGFDHIVVGEGYSNPSPTWVPKSLSVDGFSLGGYATTIDTTLTEDTKYIIKIKTYGYGDEEYESRGLVINGISYGSFKHTDMSLDQSSRFGYLEITFTPSETLNSGFELGVVTDSSTADLGSIEIHEISSVECSCQFSNNYDFFGNIIAVDVNENIITFDKFPAINNDEISKFNEGAIEPYIWFPEHPELGDGETFIGTGSFTAGWNNISSNDGSTSFGGENISEGKYSFIAGKNNLAAYGSTALGVNNNIWNQFSLGVGNANTSYSANSITLGYQNITGLEEFKGISATDPVNHIGCVAIGWENESTHSFAHTIGTGLLSSSNFQINVGRYNANDPNALFVIGVGQNPENRKNILTADGNSVSVNGNLNLKQNIVWDNTDFNASTIFKIEKPNANYNTKSGFSVLNAEITKNAVMCVGFGYNNKIINPQNNASPLYGCFVAGWSNTIYHTNCSVLGQGNMTAGKNQTLLGNYSSPTDKTLLAIGNGSSHSAKSNALEVTSEGKGLLGNSEIIDDNRAITTKKYVDDKITNQLVNFGYEEGDWTMKNVCQIFGEFNHGTSFSIPAKYVKQGNLVYIHVDWNLTLSEDQSILWEYMEANCLPFEPDGEYWVDCLYKTSTGYEYHKLQLVDFDSFYCTVLGQQSNDLTEVRRIMIDGFYKCKM